MTDTNSWNYYYKLNPDGKPNTSNLLYSPKINQEQTVMCMHYYTDKFYRKNDTNNEIDDNLLLF
jgi:hypothetical protein